MWQLHELSRSKGKRKGIWSRNALPFLSRTCHAGSFIFISFSQFIYDLFHISLTLVNIIVVYCFEQDSYFYHYNLERSHKFISFCLSEQIESLSKDTGSGVTRGAERWGKPWNGLSSLLSLKRNYHLQTKHSNWWKEGRQAEIRE